MINKYAKFAAEAKTFIKVKFKNVYAWISNTTTVESQLMQLILQLEDKYQKILFKDWINKEKTLTTQLPFKPLYITIHRTISFPEIISSLLSRLFKSIKIINIWVVTSIPIFKTNNHFKKIIYQFCKINCRHLILKSKTKKKYCKIYRKIIINFCTNGSKKISWKKMEMKFSKKALFNRKLGRPYYFNKRIIVIEKL